MFKASATFILTVLFTVAAHGASAKKTNMTVNVSAQAADGGDVTISGSASFDPGIPSASGTFRAAIPAAALSGAARIAMPFTIDLPEGSVTGTLDVPASLLRGASSGDRVGGVITGGTGIYAGAGGSFPSLTGTATATSSGGMNVSIGGGGIVGTNDTPAITPTSLVFNATVGGAAPQPQNLNIASTAGAVSFVVSTSTGTNWIQLSSLSGSTPTSIAVSVNPAGMPAGIYNASITVGSAVAAFTPAIIPVTLIISPGLTTNPGSLTFNYQSGGATPPAQIVTVGTSGAPLTFTAVATTNLGGPWLSVSPSGAPTPANLNVSVNTTGLAPGVYTGSVNLTTTGSATTSTQSIKVTLNVTPSNPTITAVVNAASFQNTPIAPGEIVTLGGSGLGPSSPVGLALDQNGKVATTLGGVQVLFGGFAAPLTYVSSTQINAVVPYEVQGLVSPVVQVKYQGQTSNAFSLVPTPTAPALFTSNGSGAGPAAALNQDQSVNTPNNPVPKGGYIVLFMTGEGQTSPAGVTAKVTTVAATGPLTPQPILPVAVIIGNQPATVVFYGEAPGFVSGVMQVNVQVPANTASGNVPILVSVGGNSSQSGVTIAVQ